MNTRPYSDPVAYRHPRSLVEAFGPYTSQRIEPAPEPMHPHDRVVLRACALAAIAMVAFLIWS